MRAKVRTYQVTLRAHSAYCECEDRKFHHPYCKHIGMFCLTLLRTAQTDTPPAYHLGDAVEREGREGKVIAVSGGLMRVRWGSGRISACTSVSLPLRPPA